MNNFELDILLILIHVYHSLEMFPLLRKFYGVYTIADLYQNTVFFTIKRCLGTKWFHTNSNKLSKEESD